MKGSRQLTGRDIQVRQSVKGNCKASLLVSLRLILRLSFGVVKENLGWASTLKYWAPQQGALTEAGTRKKIAPLRY